MTETRKTMIAMTKKTSILVLGTVGALVAMLTASPAHASDGGSKTCVENGGTVTGCYLFHVKLYGSERCLQIQDYNGKPGGLQIACRKNSVNAYVDPSIKKVLVELNTSDPVVYDNNTNRCFRTRSYLVNIGGSRVFRDKLLEASIGDQCNED